MAATKTKRKQPTQRTMEWLRKSGWTVGITEKWNAWTKQRVDLFGFIDLIAIKDSIIAIQCTSGDHHAARRTKILETEAAKSWLTAGGKIWVVSWSQAGAKGAKKLWQPRIETIDIDSFEGHERVDNSLTAALAPRAG